MVYYLASPLKERGTTGVRLINNLEISNEAHAEALRQARLAGLELR